MYRQLPNSLTIFRLVLAAVFFVVLNQYRYEGKQGDPQTWVLMLSAVVFTLAAVTDALDGYLARKWQVESTFGRIMDPFCDKVLVIGAFIYLSGPRFVIPEEAYRHAFFNMVSGVYPWMVALMLARELLVTGIRGELEGAAIKFPAKISGKLKMILQCACVPTVLVIVWLDPRKDGHGWMDWVRDVMVYATVIVTFISGVPYVRSAVAVLVSEKRERKGRGD